MFEIIDSILNVVPIVLACIGLVAILGFVVLYSIFSNWKQYREGRAAMYLARALLAIAGLITLHLFVHDDYLFRNLLRTIVYSYFAFACVWLLVTLVKAIRRGGGFAGIFGRWKRALKTADSRLDTDSNPIVDKPLTDQ